MRRPLTGVREPELLRASHIIPWAACSSDQERLNIHIGCCSQPCGTRPLMPAL